MSAHVAVPLEGSSRPDVRAMWGIGMLDGRRTAPVDGSLVSLDHEELHRVL